MKTNQSKRDTQELASWQDGSGRWTEGCERALTATVRVLRASRLKREKKDGE